MWWVHGKASEQQLIYKNNVYGQKYYSGEDPKEAAFQNNPIIYYKMTGDSGSEKFY